MTNSRRILFIVEGEDAEPKLFKAFGKALGLDVAIYEVRTNVYSLYRLLKRESFQLDVKDAVKSMLTADKKTSILDHEFQAIYLVFDCDVQDSYNHRFRIPLLLKRQVLKNFDILRAMMKYFDDEYDPTKGRLLVNYPMVESFADSNACYMREFMERSVCLMGLRGYKKIVRRRILARKKPSAFTAVQFRDVIARNAQKAFLLMQRTDQIPSQEAYVREVTQEKILDLQVERVKAGRPLSVVNTSVLMPLDAFRMTAEKFREYVIASPEKRISIVTFAPTLTKRMLWRISRDLSKQSFRNWELVCFCHAMEQDAQEGLSGYEEDARIQLRSWAHSTMSEHEIICAAAQMTKGEYVLFYDLRDHLLPEALVSLKGLTEVYPDCDVLGLGKRNAWKVRLGLKAWPMLNAPKSFDFSRCPRYVRERLVTDPRLQLSRLMMKMSTVYAVQANGSAEDYRRSVVTAASKLVLTDCEVLW